MRIWLHPEKEKISLVSKSKSRFEAVRGWEGSGLPTQIIFHHFSHILMCYAWVTCTHITECKVQMKEKKDRAWADTLRRHKLPFLLRSRNAAMKRDVDGLVPFSVVNPLPPTTDRYECDETAETVLDLCHSASRRTFPLKPLTATISHFTVLGRSIKEGMAHKTNERQKRQLQQKHNEIWVNQRV